MTEGDDWKIILRSLESLKESIESKFKDSNGEIGEQTIRTLTGVTYGPHVGYNFFDEQIGDLQELLENKPQESLQDSAAEFVKFAERVDSWVELEARYLTSNSNSFAVTLSLVLILHELELFVHRHTAPVDSKEHQRRVTKIRRSIDTLERSTNTETARLEKLDEYVKTLIEAKEAADSLPETLKTLNSLNSEVLGIKKGAEASKAVIDSVENYAKETDDYVKKKRGEIDDLVSRAELALRASTGAGLAKAFSQNAMTLKCSSRCWVVGLLFSLATAVLIGGLRMSSIFDMMQKPGLDPSLVWANILMSFALLAAPTWFAWIAAKRIAHLFRLIEDYEFKAAVSMSYEGYSREAAKYEGTDLAQRVLSSALSRFDEPPIRFVEPRDDGHPLLEMLERLFSAKWKLPVDDKKPEIKREPPNQDTP